MTPKVLLLLAAIGAPGLAIAHGDHAPIDPGMQVEARIEAVETAFGRMGATKEVNKVVEVSMGDDMQFTPSSFAFAQGDTVRFNLHNTGTVAHEFILGTANDIREHAELMKHFPTMVHDDASSKRLQPGQSADLIWQFTRAGDFVFACLIPGHADAGMHGTIAVAAVGAAAPVVAAMPAAAAPATATAGPTELTHGQVLKIDTAKARLTIRHGDIRNLGMPGMTMSFGLADRALLNGIAVGDKVDFRVEDQDAAGLVITRIVKAP